MTEPVEVPWWEDEKFIAKLQEESEEMGAGIKRHKDAQGASKEAKGSECLTCGEVDPGNPIDVCPNSKRPCGHHCNHVWTHDDCHWCGGEFVEDSDGEEWVFPDGSIVKSKEADRD